MISVAQNWLRIDILIYWNRANKQYRRLSFNEFNEFHKIWMNHFHFSERFKNLAKKYVLSQFRTIYIKSDSSYSNEETIVIAASVVVAFVIAALSTLSFPPWNQIFICRVQTNKTNTQNECFYNNKTQRIQNKSISIEKSLSPG